jgi:hypothetical protein
MKKIAHSFALTLLFLFWPSFANAEIKLSKGMDLCKNATRVVEREHKITPNLLRAISLTESGRWLEEEKVNIAWPWTVASGKAGQYFPTKRQAIAHVRQLQSQGVENIDVGCMQINLRYHPDAFANLNDAFDPYHNAEYAAQFLTRLFNEEKSWTVAASRYHSSDPTKNMHYREKVLSYWNYANKEAHEDRVGTAQAQAKTKTKTTSQEPKLVIPVAHDRMAALNNSFKKRITQQRQDMDKAQTISNRLAQYRQQMTGSVNAARNRAIREQKAKKTLTGFAGAQQKLDQFEFAKRRASQLAKWRRTVAKPDLLAQAENNDPTQPSTHLD